jgi:hypothetical protein
MRRAWSGSRLAAFALEKAEQEGLEVVPLCPFIAYYIIERHPEYEHLVAPDARRRPLKRRPATR